MFLLLGTNNHSTNKIKSPQLQQYDSSLPWAPPWPQWSTYYSSVAAISSISVSMYPFFSCCCTRWGNRNTLCRKRTFPVSLSSVTLNFRAFVYRVQLSLKVALSSRLHSPPPPLSLHCFHPPLNSLWINTGNFLPQPISVLVWGRVGVRNLFGSTHSINRFPLWQKFSLLS